MTNSPSSILLLANWPFTPFVIMPVNKRLMGIRVCEAGTGSRAMLVQWGELHNVRSAPGAGLLGRRWRGELIELFEHEFAARQDALGARVLGAFIDLDGPDRFVWLRGIECMEARRSTHGLLHGSALTCASRCGERDDGRFRQCASSAVHGRVARPRNAC